MTAIITALLPVAAKLLGWLLDWAIEKGQANKEAREAFNAFINKMNESGQASSDIREEAKSQKEELKGKLNNLKK